MLSRFVLCCLLSHVKWHDLHGYVDVKLCHTCAFVAIVVFYITLFLNRDLVCTMCRLFFCVLNFNIGGGWRCFCGLRSCVRCVRMCVDFVFCGWCVGAL